MSFKVSRLLLFITTCVLTGCGQQQREQQVSQEKKLRAEQQELIIKANQLALKEAELDKRAKHFDSLQISSDSLSTLLPKLSGNWNVNMVCSQATCSGSAVGDTKNEQWQISHQGNTVVVQAFSRQVLSRIYSGDYSDGVIRLNAQPVEPTVASNFQINVIFHPVGDSLQMEGKRTIIRPDCQIVYNLTMKKQ